MAKRTISAPKPKREMYSDRTKPSDFLRGSIVPGQKYTAWKTRDGKAPTLGKGNGPGTPYREVQKTVGPARTMTGPTPTPDRSMSGYKGTQGAIERRMKGTKPTPIRSMSGAPVKYKMDAKSKAIARRLNNG